MSDQKRLLESLYNEPDTEKILYFLESEDSGVLRELYSFADEIRKIYTGNAIHLRAILEFSNYCRQGCLYCGIRNSMKIRRFRISPDEIIEISKTIFQKGYRTLVLQSGEDPFYSTEDYVKIIRGIKSLGNIAITLSIGEKQEEEYRAYFHAGADRFLLKHETSDPVLYSRLNPGMSLTNRIKCLKILKSIGFQTGGGIMIGLPGQTKKSIADDILLFKDLELDMIGSGPYIPETGLFAEDISRIQEELTYKVIALTRIVTKNTHLPSTTALSVVNEETARRNALSRGANVIMPNETPEKYRTLYQIYPNKKRTEVSSADFLQELRELAFSMGRVISDERGDSLKASG